MTEKINEDVRYRTSINTCSSMKAGLIAIAERCASLPDRDQRSADDILGYDEKGLPN